ncbi:MAG TPA: response regulator [Phycisphaerae bacterium]|nr:response regulator [Phycisphaerae bacterium]HOI54972.1 response regulator [Phycisphaerae bacterium]
MSDQPSATPVEPAQCVFVVEDESLVAMGLQRILSREMKAEVHLFATAEAALAELERLRPDLVLMDIKLGAGMDGLAASREIMERRPCPVIVTTAFTDDKYLQEAVQSHVFGYLVKPIVARQLLSVMALARSRFAEFQRLREENETLRDALETRKLVEKAKGVLMQKKGLTEQQAYDVMRAQSQKQSRPMRDVAGSILGAADFL